MTTAVVFGGTGFIGSYFANYLLEKRVVDRILLADLRPVSNDRFSFLLKDGLETGAIKYLRCDVRLPIEEQLASEVIEDLYLIANFAAVHREPGHEHYEYYDTNLKGANNICAWARRMGCMNIIFTSSIAPYGLNEKEISEADIPKPVSAYGGSKLVAEKIHETWQAEDNARRLTIVRPGVVFGAGEGGNVSRLIKATLKGYFFYMGNRNTRKAGVYVRELVHAMTWVHNLTSLPSQRSILFNMTMSPSPSVEDYVETILKVAGVKKKIWSIPFSVLYPISFCLEGAARVVGKSQPISPVRLRKLIRSNYIKPNFLEQSEYQYIYTLESALAEWRKNAPHEWLNK